MILISYGYVYFFDKFGFDKYQKTKFHFKDGIHPIFLILSNASLNIKVFQDNLKI